MRARTLSSDIQPRMLTIKEAQIYCGFGRNMTADILKRIGARRCFGARCIRYDKRIIDKFLDSLDDVEPEGQTAALDPTEQKMEGVMANE